MNGYEHVGNCGSLNAEGTKAIQENLLKDSSYTLGMAKPSTCVSTPKLLLRFRKGYDFADLLLSGEGDACPVVTFLYGGETRELYANKNKEWLKDFIAAVSSDIEPLDLKDSESMFKARKLEPKSEDSQAGADTPAEEKVPEQKVWGRRFN